MPVPTSSEPNPNELTHELHMLILTLDNPSQMQQSSPFPTKDALGVTAWKGVEDIVELIIQVAYVATFGWDTFVILNLLATVIMVCGGLGAHQ